MSRAKGDSPWALLDKDMKLEGVVFAVQLSWSCRPVIVSLKKRASVVFRPGATAGQDVCL